MTRRRAAAFSGLAPFLAAALALSACAGTTVEAEPDATPTPTTTPALVSIPMPDFPPFPANSPPFNEEEFEQERLAQDERLWEGVLASYPDAVRPEIAFAGYVTDENRMDLHRACYEAAGLQVDEARAASDPDGPVVGVGYSADTAEEAIAGYACHAAHPEKPVRGLNPEQVGWVYDYQTTYYSPCLEANGIVVLPPPERDAYVSSWPQPTWAPIPFDDVRFSAPEAEEALNEACRPFHEHIESERAG